MRSYPGYLNSWEPSGGRASALNPAEVYLPLLQNRTPMLVIKIISSAFMTSELGSSAVTKEYNLVILVKWSRGDDAPKVTVGVVSHWPCITDCGLYQLRAQRPEGR